jgi:hypothetical protein
MNLSREDMMAQAARRFTGEPLHPIIWRGRQWAVTEYGIECLDGSYYCEAKRLGEDLPEYSWCEHMAEKDWVDIDDFDTAWLVAIAIHGARIPADQVRTALSRSRRLTETPKPTPGTFPLLTIEDLMAIPDPEVPVLPICYGWETTKP